MAKAKRTTGKICTPENRNSGIMSRGFQIYILMWEWGEKVGGGRWVHLDEESLWRMMMMLFKE